ncbi:MAG TPA: PEP/pyruvate-binding domain-containing protein, partial [Chloroflexota bacterium]|nr:PEP/pyruvate-binding domain-containing protein [Chloroflexota bacterium]
SAGVAFTAHPTTGDRTRVLVNAAWGLGQSVVDGEIEADTWLLDRDTLRVVEHTIGFKPTRRAVAGAPGAIADAPDGEAPLEPVPADAQRAPCLTADQAAGVAALALRAEAIVGGPADVEWAQSGSDLWLLQARPITALPPVTGAGPATAPPGPAPASEPAIAGPTASFPFEWPDPHSQHVNWQLRSIDQRRPEALKPLEQDVRLVWYRTFERAAVTCGRPRYRVPLYLNGYEYVGEIANPRPASDQALCRDAMERLGAALAERGETYRRVVQFPAIDAGNARLAAVDPESLAPAGLAAHLEDATRWYESLWTDHWAGPADTPMGRFTKFYKQHVAPAGQTDRSDEQIDADLRALLTYEPNLLTDAIDGLIDLARLVQREPALRALFLESTAADVLAALTHTPGGEAFRAQLDLLLQTQGLRSGAGFGTERSQILPGWSEQPALVIELVQRYVPQDLDSLLAARHAAIAGRDQRVAALREQLPDDSTRSEFDFWLAAARAQQTAFEDHNLKIDSASSALLHRALAAAGRRLAAAGLLPTTEDLWWLRLHEIALALRCLDAAPDPAPWHSLIAARAAHHTWCERLTPPPSLGSAAAPPPPEPGFGPAGRLTGPTPAPGSEPAPPPDLLVKGLPGSAGVATGVVRLVSHDDLVPDVKAGDVLVAGNAGPLWTPIFPTVAAVVLDQGVLFQHAMLTCREYGVPAVFQTKDGSQKLREGQRVTVDGNRGWILPAG